jgi:hypothetical protein
LLPWIVESDRRCVWGVLLRLAAYTARQALNSGVEVVVVGFELSDARIAFYGR